MSLTQFAMVEELAFLVKDNLPCKHLVLSVEEALVNFLKDDRSSDEMLELEPMDSYNRLLLHRLADIFGFSHYSIGEGDDRHLVLQRCTDTAMPAVLVSDLLWQYDEVQSPQVLDIVSRRDKALPGNNVELSTPQFSFEEREAAYLAARARIFSLDEFETRSPVKERPQSDPMVARRMIAHALGQRIKQSNYEGHPKDTNNSGERAKDVKVQHGRGTSVSLCNYQDVNSLSDQHANPAENAKAGGLNGSGSLHAERPPQETGQEASAKMGSCGTGKKERSAQKDHIRQEHVGAAKRMFANALGFHPRVGNLSKSPDAKQTKS